MAEIENVVERETEKGQNKYAGTQTEKNLEAAFAGDPGQAGGAWASDRVCRSDPAPRGLDPKDGLGRGRLYPAGAPWVV